MAGNNLQNSIFLNAAPYTNSRPYKSTTCIQYISKVDTLLHDTSFSNRPIIPPMSNTERIYIIYTSDENCFE